MLEIISVFISSILMIMTIYLFGKIINIKEKVRVRELILIVLTCSGLYTLIYMYSNNSLKTILVCLVYIITLYKIFDLSLDKSLILGIVYIILLIIPDMLVLLIVTKVLDISKEYCYSTLAGSMICNLSVSIIMIVITYLLSKLLKKLVNYNISTSKKIVFMSIITIIFIAFFFYKFATGYKLNENIIIYLLAIFGFMIILFTLFKQKIENEAISKKYDDLLNIMKNYESDIEEQRIMIHETRNELMTIKSKINDKEKENAIIKYIDSILGDKVSSKMSKYSKFKYLPSNGIKGFFYYKFMEAEKRGIKVSVNISKKIENSFLGRLDTKDFKDLVRMIGVYIDNAIDASTESKDKKLGIEIYLVKKDIEIIISNTFANKINIEKIGKEKFTTKGKNHGHGLLLVKHILHSNSIFEANNEIVNNLYVQKLKIKDNTNEKTQ